MRRVVFICKGNICRSPYAEAKARELGLEAASFGLQAGERKPADPAACRNALARGVDLDGHQSHRIDLETITASDLVMGMEPNQVKTLRRMAEGRGAQITLLGLWSTKPRPHIEDPLGRSDAYFQACFLTIDNALEVINRRLLSSRTPE